MVYDVMIFLKLCQSIRTSVAHVPHKILDYERSKNLHTWQQSGRSARTITGHIRTRRGMQPRAGKTDPCSLQSPPLRTSGAPPLLLCDRLAANMIRNSQLKEWFCGRMGWGNVGLG
jgi:hypothetical protein